MKNRLLIIFIILIVFPGCHNHYTPKPRGYFRITFPKKAYIAFDAKSFPYKFDIPVYSVIKFKPYADSEPFDITVTVPADKADIHLSYKKISDKNRKGQLEKLLEDARTLAYKHTIKADAIDERIFMNPPEHVYGTIYMIKGNAASPMQFYLTDSISNFLRGSFYIREVPNADSLRPVIKFIEPDIIRMIETTKWK